MKQWLRYLRVVFRRKPPSLLARCIALHFEENRR